MSKCTTLVCIPWRKYWLRRWKKSIDFEGRSRSMYRILKDIIESLLI